MPVMKLGIIGSGSWATALAKILTDNRVPINWLVRNDKTVEHIVRRHHNPNYLSSAYFRYQPAYIKYRYKGSNTDRAKLSFIAVPSAYITSTLGELPKDIFRDKKIVSAVKGILPGQNILLNDYLKESFQVSLSDYFTIMGPLPCRRNCR
jgi:glycerol-3-phosphate dehydrogenase (NAD(P)+)